MIFDIGLATPLVSGRVAIAHRFPVPGLQLRPISRATVLARLDEPVQRGR